MPKREDINRILVIGAGPIIIGQAGEFDYSGSQAVKALKALGYFVVVLNSNPATIMTDPELSDKVYIEPITPLIIEQIINRDKIDAILPTVGGQTALNVTLELDSLGIISKYNIELLGVNKQSIEMAEKRDLFKSAMDAIGLECANGEIIHDYDSALDVAKKLNFPLIIRPSLTLGGSGGGIANNIKEYQAIIKNGLELSPISELLIEESLLGWKEYELEVMRDLNDNVIIVASVENVDPMGVHTGDSITVAPSQTLTDKEYQMLRDYSIAIIRKIGVATGGSNIQFAVNPRNGDIRVIEMNPRVSRSSALVSKATGFPIAKIAAQLSVGLTLNEITNEITGTTPASFEPALDYIVVKIPRWDFEKFKVEPKLTTQMKSVGEVMAIGSNFREALQKAYRSLEIGVNGLYHPLSSKLSESELIDNISFPNPMLFFNIREAFDRDISIDKIYELTNVDLWFLDNIKKISDDEKKLSNKDLYDITSEEFRIIKLNGTSDKRLSEIFEVEEDRIRQRRLELNVLPTFKKVDTCAGEFEAMTPYFYSTYLKENESVSSDARKIIVLGGGPFRIGQGLEFDYCASQAAMLLKKMRVETIMINCNPETVSTDYDTSDKLYFEPITYEDVMNIIELENPEGVILQLGGQTPLKLSKVLMQKGIKILGTSQDNIDRAEDRGRFLELLDKLEIPYPPGGTAIDQQIALELSESIGFPVIVRPSYVLGGRGMAIVFSKEDLQGYLDEAAKVNTDHPVLIDKFLENAIEVDVDAVSDGFRIKICGIMQHIEEAGVHSGDSSCVLPTYIVSPQTNDVIREYTYRIAKELNIIGFINIQFAVVDEKVFILEVNPRASRTVPFVSKATGVPVTKLAIKAMLNIKFDDEDMNSGGYMNHYAVKSAVFSFDKFPGVDTILGPEMRSTGEVMGISEFFGEAYVKSQISAGNKLPIDGGVFISVNDHDKRAVLPIARKLKELGYSIFATLGTYSNLHVEGIDAKLINKIGAGLPNVLQLIESGEIRLIINTPLGRKAYQDDLLIRELALKKKILCITTIPAARAAADGMKWLQKHQITVHGPLKFN